VSVKTPLQEIAELVVWNQFARTTTIQRRLRKGFKTTVDSLNQLEELGVVGPADDSGDRTVLVPHTQLQSVLAKVREIEAVKTDG
jgi:DNA segregation ATPase FtsK/SpoIIIE-like protein